MLCKKIGNEKNKKKQSNVNQYTSNILMIKCCVLNKQVFGLYRLY